MPNKHVTKIQAWWDAIGPFDDVLLNTLSKQALEQLLEDEEFCESFLRAYLYQSIIGIGSYFMRRPVVEDVDLAEGRPMRHVDAKEVAEIVERTQEGSPLKSWRNWFETDPETGIKLHLQDMDSRQLISAAERYEFTASGNLKAGAFLRLLAGKLESGESVKDRWTQNQMYLLQENIEIDRVRYTLKQMRKTAAVKGSAA